MKAPTILAVACLAIAASVQAQSYSIDWYKITGGGGTTAGGQYSLTGAIGQPDAGSAMSGGGYSLTGGFWSLVSVVQTAGAPTLAVSHSGNSVLVSWPSPSQGFVLQQNATLAPGSWTPASAFTVSDDGTTKSITITAPTGNLFFRLKQ